MATEKKEIQFHKSMNIDKRNRNFAYLRKNVLNESTPGLYPSIDYYLTEPSGSPIDSTWTLIDVIGSDKRDPDQGADFDIKLIYEDNDNDTRFFNLGSNAESNTELTNIAVKATAFGIDGVYVFTSDAGKVYRVNHTSSSTPLIGTLDGNSLSVEIGGFDGLRYWWAGSGGIWRQLPGANAFNVFSNPGVTFEKMDFYRDFMVLFGQQRGPDFYIYFWDKQNTVAFSKRIIIKNATFLSGGVVDGVLMCVYSVGNSTNAKEYEGKIVVSAFDGEGFKEINSIKGGRENVSIPTKSIKGTTMDTGNQVMLFAVDNNDREAKNPDLYNNFVYKVRNNGQIEVEMLPITNVATNYASVARVFYNFNLIGVARGTGTLPKIYINDEQNTEWDDYRGYSQTEYITEFFENSYNYHALCGLSITFEKLFKNGDAPVPPNGPELFEVYYRTSERLAFTLLGTITPAKVIANVNTRQDPAVVATEIPLNMQTYQFIKHDDGTPLPEYNEIQFKFKSLNGFSAISAWREYSYLTRNILN